MIRIKTVIGDKKVYTLHYGDKWFTISPGQSMTAPSLLEAGQNHLKLAIQLRDKATP